MIGSSFARIAILSITFGNNILSLNVQRSLSSASQSLGQYFERLSSGQRINKASDDAAGLSIADRLRADARLSSGAYRNINDGISLLNVASGTLGQQTNILLRLQELAEQSANGTYSTTQRTSLSREYLTLIQEFGRLGVTSAFNGVKPLAGTHNGGSASIVLQAGLTGSTQGQLSISNSNTAYFSGRIDRNTMVTSDIASFSGERELTYTTHNGNVARLGNYYGREIYIGFYSTVYGQIDFNILEEGTDGSFSAAANGFFKYTQATGEVTTSGAASGAQTVSLSFMDGESGDISIDFRGLQISSSTGAGAPNLGGSSNLEFTNIEYSNYALTALDTIRRRLDDLNLIKGQIGALQSRLSIASEIAQITKETSLSAESRIRDADIAEETAGMVATKIRQETASALLGKANRAPELLLSLLTT